MKFASLILFFVLVLPFSLMATPIQVIDLQLKLVSEPIEFTRQGNTITVGKSYKNKLLKSDLSKELSAFEIELAKKDGKPYGIQITSLEQHSLLKKAGFKKGDVIRSVNGRSVVSPRGLLKIFTFMNGHSSAK